MTFFWISTALLTLFTCALVAIPFIKQKANQDAELRDELNKALYKDRLSELEVETEEGLVEDQQALIADLKQSLLDDVPQEEMHDKTSISPMAVFIPSCVFVVVLSYFMYAQFGASKEVAEWQQVNANLPGLSQKLMSPEGASLTDDEMSDLTLALRTRLYHNPSDSTGWLLLGRIGLANRDVTTAIDAMKKAYRLEPDNDDVALGYAQALMLSQDESEQNEARIMLTRLVQQDYVDLRVFSLLAFDAFERQDYMGATKYWSIMQQMIGPDDSRYEMLQRSIESARSKMGDTFTPSKSVSVTISITDAVQAPADASLIVSVHPADGSPMPIAAARYPLGTFPRTVVLDDGNSMLQGQKLSDLEAVIVKARIDSDGSVSTRDNDWYGESEVVELGHPVSLEISQQY
ncbi:c-type cytochrome biogenesis protein CcmI [Vibrio sp. 10N.286.49.B3]|uniref:c-type cytochrome biogenesis protein CcmI n=1 Tax=Vibrio sp. 10N.286.49.B3 TaxID=1880855 RepID=UPI000C847BFE|nr:c-type cytochrome biogenesis protein CcmI [Vibrio sp. 10N.286.49.B3]PMH41008.1 c-type cytochrome biogenesis protein CcmI [Vibrio sp. 10N.286.49.B3]